MKAKMNVREKKLKMFELQQEDPRTRKWITIKYFKTLEDGLKELMGSRHEIELRVVRKVINAKVYSRKKGGIRK